MSMMIMIIVTILMFKCISRELEYNGLVCRIIFLLLSFSYTFSFFFYHSLKFVIAEYIQVEVKTGLTPTYNQAVKNCVMRYKLNRLFSCTYIQRKIQMLLTLLLIFNMKMNDKNNGIKKLFPKMWKIKEFFCKYSGRKGNCEW